MAITLTESAINEVRRVLASQQHPDWGLRIGVKGGGCSGLSYTMGIEEKPGPSDKVFEFGDVRVFCDPKSYLFLNGLTVDFSNELLNGGFRFVNPNATKSCGCGTSFSA
ncbi:MAG: iron-sulfur cluster assembly accessory protein [Candidatus Sumerlaeaceae bacterium]|nr:iron-sulfur cluster assembly accessory protein [Candidatus Sumerlaeaceae bacterium]